MNLAKEISPNARRILHWQLGDNPLITPSYLETVTGASVITCHGRFLKSTEAVLFSCVDLLIIDAPGAYLPDSVYHTLHGLRDQPKHWIEPSIIVACGSEMSDSVMADLRLLGAQTLFRPTLHQVALAARVDIVLKGRICRSGVVLVETTPCDYTMVGPLGEVQFRQRNKRERQLFATLASERRSFSICELSYAVDCDDAQIRVLIERLRRLYDHLRIPLGIGIPSTIFIETIPEVHGYRLFAHLKQRARQRW